MEITSVQSTPDLLQECHQQGSRAAQQLRLPFHRTVRHGMQGNWLGAGVGSSIDFQDHRHYAPGDDPRYIDWRAFARTGQYTMKLFREEVTPKVDLILDGSPSMFFDPQKKRRVWQVFYFVVESALQARAALRCFLVRNDQIKTMARDTVLSYSVEIDGSSMAEASIPALAKIEYQSGSLRVFISDLLFPATPSSLLNALCSRRGQGVILAPFCRAEASPVWSGNVTFIECESNGRRKQLVDPQLLKRYEQRYGHHFNLWRDECRRYLTAFARIDSHNELLTALREEALADGALELWG